MYEVCSPEHANKLAYFLILAVLREWLRGKD
jgi:hypothetical protein